MCLFLNGFRHRWHNGERGKEAFGEEMEVKPLAVGRTGTASGVRQTRGLAGSEPGEGGGKAPHTKITLVKEKCRRPHRPHQHAYGRAAALWGRRASLRRCGSVPLSLK